MNLDRLTQMSSDTIVAGLTTKWTDAYSFLNFTFSSVDIDNGITFDSLNSNQFALDLAYYLEPEDIYFLMFQATDHLIQVLNGINTIQLTVENLKQILIHKWKRSITQINDLTLNGINVDADLISFVFSQSSSNINDTKSNAIFKSKTILSNYNEKYLSFEDFDLTYPSLILKYRLNWDVVKSRFSHRMSMNLGHNLFLEQENVTLQVDKKYRITPYTDGIISDNVSFSSSNTSTATVDSGGLVTFLKEGVVAITVTDTDFSLTKTCNIRYVNHRFNLNYDNLFIYDGESKSISAYIDGIKTNDIDFVSSDESIATIDSSGKVLFTSGNGTCKVTVTDRVYGFVSVCHIIKHPAIFGLNVSTMKLTSQNTFKLECYLNGKITKNVTFSSSDESLAIVSNEGVVSATNQETIIKPCYITATHLQSGKTAIAIFNVALFDINRTNLVAYYSAVDKTNLNSNYNVWEDKTGNGHNMVPYTNETIGNTGLFSDTNSAGWKNNWFVFNSVSTTNKGHWRITPSPFLLTPNKNLAFGIRFKANFLGGYPSMFSVRSSSSSPSFSFCQAQAQNTFQFETGIFDAATKFTYVNAPMTDTTVVIQTISETVADVYINGVKTTTVKISKNNIVNTFASIGAERQGQWGNFFNGAIKAIALYDTTSALKTDAEMIKLSQDLMALA